MIETFRKILKHCKGRTRSLWASLAFSFLKSAFGITQLFAIVVAVDVLLGNRAVQNGIIIVSVLTVICVLGNYITSYFGQSYILKTGMFFVADTRISLGNRLKLFPLGFFNNSSRTQTITTLTTTLSGMENASVMVMTGIISGLFDAAAIFVFMLFYNYIIGLIAGVGMIVYAAVIGYQMKQSRKNAPCVQKAQDTLAKSTLSFLQGIKVTKSFSFKNGDEQLKNAVEESAKANIGLTSKSMPSFYMSNLVIAIFESIIIIVTAVLFFQTRGITVTMTVVLLLFSFMVYASLNQAGSMLSMIGMLETGLDEVEKIEKENELEVLQPKEFVRDNSIEFRNVSFSYGTEEVLQDVSFTVEPNSCTALVGPSGSGKTTLCELIPRFYDVCGGKVLVGGADVRHLEDYELRKNISMVFQRVYLFEDTVLNNIRFGKPDASLEEVRNACRKAQCDEFIMSLPDGYNTVLEEGGNNLSGGEKQRLSIARAIIKDAPIIVLDEATASIDPENEYEVQKALEELKRNKTVIMIAHKLKTVRNANQIIVLNHGKTVQKGTHRELSQTDGLYHDFILARKKSAEWNL